MYSRKRGRCEGRNTCRTPPKVELLSRGHQFLIWINHLKDCSQSQSTQAKLGSEMRNLDQGVYVGLSATASNERCHCSFVIDKPQDITILQGRAVKPRRQRAAKGFTWVDLLRTVLPSKDNLMGDNAGHTLRLGRLPEDHPTNA